jgi:hypothetical protein
LSTGTNPHFSVRREKVLCVRQVQVLSEKLSVYLSSYQDGQTGNHLVEALGTKAHHGWVSKSTGRNMREA